MMPPDMTNLDPNLYRELRPDEQLLWWCKPDPLRRTTALRFTSQTIYYGALSGIILFVIVMMIGSFDTLGFAMLVPMLFLSLILFFALSIFFLLLALPHITTRALSRTLYGITNQRVIVITQRSKGPAIRSHTRADFGPLERIDSSEGWGDISYSRPRFSNTIGFRIRILEQLNGIPHVREVETLLLRVFKNAQPLAPTYWNHQQEWPQQQASFVQPE